MVKLSKGTHYEIVRIKNAKNVNLSSTVKVGWCDAESVISSEDRALWNSPLGQEIAQLDIHVIVKIASEC